MSSLCNPMLRMPILIISDEVNSSLSYFAKYRNLNNSTLDDGNGISNIAFFIHHAIMDDTNICLFSGSA